MKFLWLIPIATLVTISFTPKPALADVIFARDGQDLLVSIDREYSFDVTVGANRSSYGVIFHDVYSVAPATFHLEQPEIVTSQMTLDAVPVSPTSATYGSWGQPAVEIGDLDSNDFWGIYSFGGNLVLTPGDTMRISAGIVTVNDYFDDVDAVLPDLATSNLQLTDSAGNALSNYQAAAVPEPASFAVCGAFVAIFWVRRHRWGRSVAGKHS